MWGYIKRIEFIRKAHHFSGGVGGVVKKRFGDIGEVVGEGLKLCISIITVLSVIYKVVGRVVLDDYLEMYEFSIKIGRGNH